MRTTTIRLFYAFALLIVVAAGALIVRATGDPTKAAASDVVVTSPVRPPETTTTTVDLSPAYEFAGQWQRAEVGAFLQKWWEADLTAYVTAVKASQDETARQQAAAGTGPHSPSPKLSTAVTKPAQYVGDGDPFLNCVVRRESNGQSTVVNGQSGASGLFQYLDSTWRAMGYAAKYGVPKASMASPAQQWEAARDTLARSGRSPWAGGNYSC